MEPEMRATTAFLTCALLLIAACGSVDEATPIQDLPTTETSSTPTPDPHVTPPTTAAEREAPPPSTAAPTPIREIAPDPVALDNKNDPKSSIGRVCWAFTELTLAAIAAIVEPQGRGDLPARTSEIRDALRLEGLADLSPDIQSFARSLDGVSTAVAEAAASDDAVAVALDLEDLPGAKEFDRAAQKSADCGGYQDASRTRLD